MTHYTITEPHPTVAQNTFTHSGRGGAGNTFRAPVTTPATGVAYKSTAPQNSGRFYSGRGGAGNVHSTSGQTAYSFDEEYARAEIRETASTMGHVGRGGAGNIFTHKARKSSDASSRRDSSSTNGSVRAGFWGRLSGASIGSQ